jgi:hypothetical protein
MFHRPNCRSFYVQSVRNFGLTARRQGHSAFPGGSPASSGTGGVAGHARFDFFIILHELSHFVGRANGH